MVKNISNKIKIITAYNIFCVLYSLFFSLRAGFVPVRLFLALEFGLPLLVINYFLLKKSRFAFYLMLAWFAIQSITFNFPSFSFSIFYGVFIDLHIMHKFIGFNPITIIMFFILFSTRKDILSKPQSKGVI